MGCVQTKPSSNSPPRGIEKLKSDHGYVSASSVTIPRPRAVAAKTVPEEEKVDKPPEVTPELTPRAIAVGEDELVDGWPRWLVNNIPKEVLAGLVPKSADSYVKIDKVGQGTYSNVYKARDRETGKVFALKKVRFDTAESESVKFMAREIMILQKLDHPNVLKLEGLATSRMHYSIYLVFDFMQSDLTGVISRSNRRLTETQIKCYMHQLLSGLQHCHERGILHRDIKGSNILIDKDGVLKIGDFGLANYFIPKPKRPLTNRVVTLWYRAPELLLGSTDYGVGVDLWSAGCLLAEMFVGRPIMPGRTEVEQLHRIFKLCGSPSGDYWKRLKLSTNFRPPQPYKSSISEAFKEFPVWTQKMLTMLLALDPHNRGTATSALQNELFTATPLPCNVLELPVLRQEEREETNCSSESRRRITSRPRKQTPEKIDGQIKPDQTMDAVKVDSELLKEDDYAKQLRHIQERRSKDDHASTPKPAANQLYGFEKRSSCTSGLHRFSVDQMPTYFAPIENTNISEKKVDTFQHYGLEKRFNPASDFISFSGEWSPKNQASMD